MRLHVLLTLAFFALGGPAIAGETSWPQFRGADGSATSGERLPEKWAADQNIAWKTKVPGYGWSSPIVWGDKVFVTTAVTDNQRKPAAGFGGEGGTGGRGGRGRFGMPQPGQILPTFLQDRLELSDAQKKQLDALQKDVSARLDKLLTEEQRKALREPPDFSRGFGAFPQPGQIVSAAAREKLKLTPEQTKQVDALQKDVDGKLAAVLNDGQKKQLAEMRQRFGGGRGGRGGFGGGRPPDAVYRWEVYCLDRATGKVLWKQVALEGKPRIPTQPSNTYASETPATDGERVYAYFGMHGVYCYDMQGNLVWKVDLGSYPMALGFGTGSSPVLADGRLFIQCDNEKQSFLVALDAKTGKELWRVNRPEHTSWSSPFAWRNKVRTEIVCIGSPKSRSYDPATGQQLWELGGLVGQPKASPAADAELLYVGTGGGSREFGPPGEVRAREGGAPNGERRGRRGGEGEGEGGGRPLFAVKAGASGEISLKKGESSNEGVAWHLPMAGPPTASPVVYDGLIYILEERTGMLACYDAKTGKQIYKERLPGARGFTSSPWAADGKVFCLDDAGTTFVVQAGPAFKVLGKNAVGEMCWSSPAATGGELILRTVEGVYCVREGPAK